jgi:hypothetical protein
MIDDDFAGLPESTQAKLAEAAWKYLRLPSIPDAESALKVLACQQLEIEVKEAHIEHLEKTKTKVEQSGREWNRENYLRYCSLREHE